jgi:hypothetical protein
MAHYIKSSGAGARRGPPPAGGVFPRENCDILRAYE